MLRGLISEKDMNSKMTINSQSSTTEPKEKKTKQTTRTGRESQTEITWRVISREREGGEWGRSYREQEA